MGIYQAELRGGGAFVPTPTCPAAVVRYAKSRLYCSGGTSLASSASWSTRQQAAAKTSAIVLTKKTVAKKSMKQHPPNSMNQSK